MKVFVPKLVILFSLVIVGMVVAGAYGALHNQISYTISPEYFTLFKFEQFQLQDPSIPERLRASIVGFQASWWMGFPVGLLIGLIGFAQSGYRRMLTVSLKAIGFAVAFTLLFGLCGLTYGFIETSNINLANYNDWYLPPGVVDTRRFICAGYMHNSAYIGGVLSILVAWIYQIVVRIRDSRRY